MQRVHQGKTIESPVGTAQGRLGQKRFLSGLLFKATRPSFRWLTLREERRIYFILFGGFTTRRDTSKDVCNVKRALLIGSRPQEKNVRQVRRQDTVFLDYDTSCKKDAES